MALSITYLWLAVGVLMLAAEALGASGVGLMFAGLGCLTVGALLNLGALAEDTTLLQFIAFFMATSFWTLILWKPMRRFYSSKSHVKYHNMVGDIAIIGAGGLKKGHTGEAQWSGTIMKAALAEDAGVEKLDAGAQVTIVAVKGAMLVVKPKI